MNRGVAAVAFAGAMSLASALAWAGTCYINTQVSCCSIVMGGPGSEPCGGVTCTDIIVGNPQISYVDTATSGNKTTVVWDTDQYCKWENRVCEGGICRQGSKQTMPCTPSRLVAPLTPCP